MRSHTPPPPSAADSKLVAEELARVLCSGEWHDFESLFSAAADVTCGDEQPCRELLRLHVYGRLQNWHRHGWLEHEGDKYRVHGDAVPAFTEHAAAEHCRDLLATVLATAKGIESNAEEPA
jgi:hypothetical protein